MVEVNISEEDQSEFSCKLNGNKQEKYNERNCNNKEDVNISEEDQSECKDSNTIHPLEINEDVLNKEKIDKYKKKIVLIKKTAITKLQRMLNAKMLKQYIHWNLMKIFLMLLKKQPKIMCIN